MQNVFCWPLGSVLAMAWESSAVIIPSSRRRKQACWGWICAPGRWLSEKQSSVLIRPSRARATVFPWASMDKGKATQPKSPCGQLFLVGPCAPSRRLCSDTLLGLDPQGRDNIPIESTELSMDPNKLMVHIVWTRRTFYIFQNPRRKIIMLFYFFSPGKGEAF